MDEVEEVEFSVFDSDVELSLSNKKYSRRRRGAPLMLMLTTETESQRSPPLRPLRARPKFHGDEEQKEQKEKFAIVERRPDATTPTLMPSQASCLQARARHAAVAAAAAAPRASSLFLRGGFCQ